MQRNTWMLVVTVGFLLSLTMVAPVQAQQKRGTRAARERETLRTFVMRQGRRSPFRNLLPIVRTMPKRDGRMKPIASRPSMNL